MKKVPNSKILTRLRRDTRGAMAVEFALILPVFIAMLFGTLEIGNILFAKSTLQQGIETAGRYAMIHLDATTDEIKAEAVAQSSYLGSLSPTFSVTQTLIGGVTYSTISVKADYQLIVPFFNRTSISLSSQVSVPQSDPADFS